MSTSSGAVQTAEVSLHSYRFVKFSASNANIPNRVRAAFDNTDGFHGGVDENRLGAGQPHGSKILRGLNPHSVARKGF